MQIHWIFFYKSEIIRSRWHPWWELDALTFIWQLIFLEGGSAGIKGICLQALPPFPFLGLALGSLRLSTFFSRTPIFFSLFPQCGAWSQSTDVPPRKTSLATRREREILICTWMGCRDKTQMVENELLHNESIPGMVCEACDACCAEMANKRIIANFSPT